MIPLLSRLLLQIEPPTEEAVPETTVRGFPANPFQSWETFQTFLDYPFVSIGDFHISIWTLVKLILFPIVAILFAKFAKKGVMRVLGKVSHIDFATRQTISTIIYYVLLFAGMMWAITTAGISTTSLAVFSGGLGVGIGLGLQDSAKNFISGLIMMFSRTVKPGDVIALEDVQGTVLRIGSYSTSVKTVQDATVIVPNSQILDEKFINWTHDTRNRMLEIPIGVHYNSDVTAVMEVMLQAADDTEGLLKDPAPAVLLTEFGDNSINFLARVWTDEPLYNLPIISAYNRRVAELFQERKITIPYPQRDVYIHQVPPLEKK